MAYFYNTNYDQYHDNYQYYHHHPYNYNSHESRYVHNYSNNVEYNYNYNYNSYELTPTKALVGYYYSNDYNNNNDFNQSDFLASNKENIYETGDYFYDPVSTQIVISYSTVGNNEITDLDYPEYDSEPFVGGYDICATYGKPLPPSNEICYPPTNIANLVQKTDNNAINSVDEGGDEDEKIEGDPKPINGNVVTQVIQEETDSKIKDNVISSEDEDEDEDDEDLDDENFGGDPKPINGNVVTQVIQKEIDSKIEDNVIDSDDEDEDEDEDDEDLEDENFEGDPKHTNGNVVTQEEIDTKSENLEDKKTEIRRQIPPGYGIEGMDICEGLFGGYFPCLSKRNNRVDCEQCGGEVKSNKKDDYEYWQGTVDYLFGNPNPYGGAMPEKGSYGDPMYYYQRSCPQKSIVGEFKNEESSSLLYSSRVNYGYNGDYYKYY
ncbi:hypothetical protein RND81_07G136300 [Saponaria officinalis]|uniref:Uncharacterized protein n=1 Tax=Saponaria officinalis TaxID=3572 RepID=A0AAW1JRI1_SAPOF